MNGTPCGCSGGAGCKDGGGGAQCVCCECPVCVLVGMNHIHFHLLNWLSIIMAFVPTLSRCSAVFTVYSKVKCV